MLSRLFKKAKDQVPKISVTEMEALKAGTVSIEGKIFSGNLTTNYLRNQYKRSAVSLPSIDKIVNAYSSHKLETNKGLYDDDMSLIKEAGFFGLEADKKIGGLGLTPYEHSKQFHQPH